MKQFTPFYVAVLVLGAGLLACYPYYQYYVDPDGTAYLTLAQKYAEGDWMRAVNGYWSPWSCWLTAVVMRLGVAAIPASVGVNFLGAAGYLGVSQSIFVKLGLPRSQQWLYGCALAVFGVYAVYAQSFDDLWECFFLLLSLRIQQADTYSRKPGWWVANGLVGGLAYFAKAYAFPFFMLQTIVFAGLLCRRNGVKWATISAVSVATMLLVSAPWLWLLHQKYGSWIYATSGSLNMAWYLEGHPHWKDGIGALLPPHYVDSPWYWEDPWYVNGYLPHFWDSWQLMGKQVLRLGYNVLRLAISLFQLTIAGPVIFALAVARALARRVQEEIPMQLALALLLLFPLAYLPINFESRYIWTCLPLLLVFGSSWAARRGGAFNAPGIAAVIALSVAIVPIYFLAGHLNEGRQEYEAAAALKRKGISGSFASLALPGNEVRRVERLAYFSGMSFYSNSAPAPDSAAWMADLCRYKIRYVIDPEGAGERESKRLAPSHFIPVFQGNGFRCFEFRP